MKNNKKIPIKTCIFLVAYAIILPILLTLFFCFFVDLVSADGGVEVAQVEEPKPIQNVVCTAHCETREVTFCNTSVGNSCQMNLVDKSICE